MHVTCFVVCLSSGESRLDGCVCVTTNTRTKSFLSPERDERAVADGRRPPPPPWNRCNTTLYDQDDCTNKRSDTKCNNNWEPYRYRPSFALSFDPVSPRSTAQDSRDREPILGRQRRSVQCQLWRAIRWYRMTSRPCLTVHPDAAHSIRVPSGIWHGQKRERRSSLGSHTGL